MAAQRHADDRTADVTDDTIPVLDTPENPSPLDLRAYRDVVLDRFGNPAIADTNQRVAMDGFSKVPGFIAPTIRERLARGDSIDSVAMLPALFLAYLQRWHKGEIAYTYQDQAMDPAAAHAICESADPVARLRKLIEERQSESVEILRGWMEVEEESR